MLHQHAKTTSNDLVERSVPLYSNVYSRLICESRNGVADVRLDERHEVGAKQKRCDQQILTPRTSSARPGPSSPALRQLAANSQNMRAVPGGGNVV